MKVGNWIQGSPGNDRNGNPIPGKVFVIRKDNRRKRDGGAGVIWTCTCKKGRDLIPCRHLRLIYKAADDGTLPPQLKLTADGRRAAARCGCIRAAEARKASSVIVPPVAPPPPPPPPPTTPKPPQHPRSWLRPKPHPRSRVHGKKRA